MKFEIKKRFSNEVKFTAEIDCENNAPINIKIGLAVKWALKNNANLSDADLWNADLSDANLSDANLSNADLRNADLINANLRNANLINANLSDANLSNADLRNADLSDADLSNADLINANLSNANLSNADLSDANLWNASGNKKEIKTIQIESYSISYTCDVLQIGCERYSIFDWMNFSDERILKMDGRSALKFWRKWKEWIFKTIELSPAKAPSSE